MVLCQCFWQSSYYITNIYLITLEDIRVVDTRRIVVTVLLYMCKCNECKCKLSVNVKQFEFGNVLYTIACIYCNYIFTKLYIFLWTSWESLLDNKSAYFNSSIISVADQRTRECKQTAKNRPNLEIYNFSQNCLQTSFIPDYLTLVGIISNYMPFELEIGATFELF
jgi:hypothetical protein